MTSSLDLMSRLKGEVFNQFGMDVLITCMPFRQLEAIFDIDHNVQRELDLNRRNQIRQYIMDNIESGFDFAPFIFSARGAIKIEKNNILTKEGKRIFIIDGQHRYLSLSSAVNRLKQKREALMERGKMNDEEYRTTGHHLDHLLDFPITLQIYLDLTKKQEQQLFTDINTARRDAHPGLVMRYDHRDEYVVLTQKIAKQLVSLMEIEWEVSKLTQTNTSLTSLTVIKRCLIALFEGRISGNHPSNPQPEFCNKDDLIDIGLEFFRTLTYIFPDQAWNRTKYTSGLAGIQIALAFTVFQYIKVNRCDYNFAFNQLKKLKKQCTWMHTDPLYKNFYDKKNKKIRRHSDYRSIQKITNKFLGCL